jgi:hypothetical protein
MPAFLSIAVVGMLVSGCAKKNHMTPSGEPSGAPCSVPTSSASTTAAALTRYANRLAASQSRRPADYSYTPSPERSADLTVVQIQSEPAGLCSQVEAGGNSSFSKIGKTPAKNTPPFADAPYTFQIVPNNGNAAYSYVMDQIGNGATTMMYYNQNADTFGSIAAVTTQSFKRKTTARSHLNFRRLLHVPVQTWLNKPAFSTTKLEVRYRAAALMQHNRRPDDLERLARADSGRNIGFARQGLITRIVRVAQGDSADALTSRLRANAEVYDVHPVALRYKSSRNPVSINDPDYANAPQWDFPQIQVQYAWGYNEGSSSVPIAIIDTGADQLNNDLSPKLAYGESDVNGQNTVGLAASADTDGHGTNVSGIAAADTNNAYGVAGVGFNCVIDIFRIFPSGQNQSASTDDEAQAIYNAVKRGVKVISLSLGSSESGGWDSVEHDAVEYAISQGTTVVAAAGNERTPTSNPGVDFPGAYDGVIAVGASALDDSADPGVPQYATEYVASYSNSGPQLSIVAPGGDPSGDTDDDSLHWITNLYTTQDTSSSGCQGVQPCEAEYAGTSQATPHVSGTVALMLTHNPALTPAQIKSILQSTADDIGDVNQGFGRLNAYRALAAVYGDSNGIKLPSFINFVAFAYDNTNETGQTVPHIIDQTFPTGVPVASDGTFRVADVLSSANPYRIAVWADLNGDGKVDAGDFFAYTQDTCTATAPCTEASGLTAVPVPNGYTLP